MTFLGMSRRKRYQLSVKGQGLDPKHGHTTALVPLGKSIDLPHGVSVSTAAMVLPEKLSFDDWQSIGHMLVRIDTGVQWWLGDWWHYGFHRYGERKAITIKQGSCRYTFQSLMNLGWVAGRVRTSFRNELLSWTHHYAVAALEPAEQKRWLDRAAKSKMSVARMRERMFQHERRQVNWTEIDRGLHHADVLELKTWGWTDGFEVDHWRELEFISRERIASVLDRVGKAAKYWTQLEQYLRAVHKQGPKPLPKPPDPQRIPAIDARGNRKWLLQYRDGRVVDAEPAKRPRKVRKMK